MSDTVTPTPGQGAPTSPTTPPADPSTAPVPQQDKEEVDWKAMARTWEARAKENKAAADKLKALEDAAKSTEQRLTEKVSALEAELQGIASAKQVDAWRAEVAEKTGLPAGVLRGSTLEDLQAHAKELQAYVASVTKPKPVPTEGQSLTTPTPSDTQTFVRKLFT